MDDKHIDLILSNIDELIQLTDYSLLMKECVDIEILFPSMQQEIEQNTVDVKERHLKLLRKITKRGPNAFRNFMDILNNNFIDAARLLIAVPIESISSNNNNSNCNNNDNNNNNNIINNSTNNTRNNSNINNLINNNNNNNNNNNGNNSNNTNTNTNVVVNEKDISIRSMRKMWNRPVVTVNPRRFEPYTIEVNPTVPITVKPSMKIYYHPKIDCYSMKSYNRGVFFLVNNIQFSDGRCRNGAAVDRDNLVTLFRGMGFTIYYYEDLTSEEFFLLVNELVNSRDLRLTDCLVFALLTHGELKDEVQYVEFSDCSATNIKTILEKFNNKNCRHLFNKPKIFLFPFCRGHVSDGGITYMITKEISTENDSTVRWVKESINVPTYSDMHICYASVRGFQTHRDPTFGSWYIELMCQIYAEHAHDTAFEDLLKMVGNSVSKRRSEKNYLQTASNENIGFNKVLYFNPGYYET